MDSLTLIIEPFHVAIAQCVPSSLDEINPWCEGSRFWSVTQTRSEVSIVLEQNDANLERFREMDNVKLNADWSLLRVAGTLDFSLVGILSRLTGILAERKISVFVISTYDTDYLMVKECDLSKTIDAFEASQLQVVSPA